MAASAITKQSAFKMHLATIQIVSSTAKPAWIVVSKMRDFREIPPPAEGINGRFSAAYPLIRTEGRVFPVNDRRYRVNRVART